MTNPIIILGSSRSKGKTFDAVQAIIGNQYSVPIIDLNTLNISPYDYEHLNSGDDCLPLMRKIVDEHDLIVLATPVYWYTMSAQMKIFLDRWSDLLKIDKETGRKLKGKRLFIIASFGTSIPKGFEDAFSQTCEYIEMIYEGCSFIYSGGDLELLKENAKQIAFARKIMGI